MAKVNKQRDIPAFNTHFYLIVYEKKGIFNVNYLKYSSFVHSPNSNLSRNANIFSSAGIEC